MKKFRNLIIAFMICFTGGCFGSSLREYFRFRKDKAIYDNAGADWEGIVREAMTSDLIWWGAVMLILTIALVVSVILLKKKDRQEQSE